MTYFTQTSLSINPRTPDINIMLKEFKQTVRDNEIDQIIADAINEKISDRKAITKIRHTCTNYDYCIKLIRNNEDDIKTFRDCLNDVIFCLLTDRCRELQKQVTVSGKNEKLIKRKLEIKTNQLNEKDAEIARLKALILVAATHACDDNNEGVLESLLGEI